MGSFYNPHKTFTFFHQLLFLFWGSVSDFWTLSLMKVNTLEMWQSIQVSESVSDFLILSGLSECYSPLNSSIFSILFHSIPIIARSYFTCHIHIFSLSGILFFLYILFLQVFTFGVPRKRIKKIILLSIYWNMSEIGIFTWQNNSDNHSRLRNCTGTTEE